MKKLYSAIFAMSLLAIQGCSNEDTILQEPQETILEATIGTQTKVGFDETGKAFWSDGDQICIPGKEACGHLDIQTGAGTPHATFSGVSETLGKYAVYPYGNHTLEGDLLKFEIKGWRSGILGTDFWDGDAASRPSTQTPMWGKIENGKVNFKHLGGVLFIRLSDIPVGKFSVVITADQRLSGTFEADLTAVNPAIVTDNTTSGQITISSTNDEKAPLKAGIIYAQIPTGEFTNLTITVNSNNQAIQKRTFKKITVNRGDLVILANKGAAFNQAKVHKIAAPAEMADHRWSAFDGKYALLVGTAGSYAMTLEDIKADNKTNYIQLPGGFSGQLANGHAYISKNVYGANSSFNIEHIDLNTNPSTATIIYDHKVSETGYKGTGRFGDNMSMDLDEKGNGYIFFQENGEGASKDVIRLTVTNYTTISAPDLLTSTVGTNKANYTYDTVTKIEGTDQYFHSGASCYPQIVDKDMNATYSAGYKPELIEYASVRAFNFNGKRYLFGATTGRGKDDKGNLVEAVANLYDISNGASVQEGITNYSNGWGDVRAALFTQKIGGNHGGTAFVNVNYYVEKDVNGNDTKLYLFGSSKTDGFFVAEVPAAK